MPQPHDRLVRSVFADPEQAALLLQLALEPADLDDLEISTLQRAPGQLVSLVLRAMDVDLVFRARVRRVAGAGRSPPAWVVFVIEHLSKPTRWAVSRAFQGVGQLHEDWRRSEPGARVTPLFVPLLLFHHPRASAWRGPRSMGELVACPPGRLERLRRARGGDFELGLLDLADWDLSRLLRAAGPAQGKLALLLLRELRRDPDPAALFRRARPLLRRLYARADSEERMLPLLRYTRAVRGEAVMKQLEAQESRVGGTRVQRAFRTSAEELRENEAREILESQLRIKFDRIPRQVRARIAQATLPQLHRWAKRVITCDSLAEVFAAPARRKARRPAATARSRRRNGA